LQALCGATPSAGLLLLPYGFAVTVLSAVRMEPDGILAFAFYRWHLLLRFMTGFWCGRVLSVRARGRSLPSFIAYYSLLPLCLPPLLLVRTTAPATDILYLRAARTWRPCPADYAHALGRACPAAACSSHIFTAASVANPALAPHTRTTPRHTPLWLFPCSLRIKARRTRTYYVTYSILETRCTVLAPLYLHL